MTSTHTFMQVDAFTTTPLQGNPCAIVFEADDLTEEVMQQIALEMNLSETSFVLKSTVADARVRYFTPGEEIPMAGHPTIATVFALMETGRLQLSGPCTHVTLEMKAGLIPVEVYSENGIVKQVVMTQNKPQFLTTYSPECIAPVFGLSPSDLLPGVPIQTVSTGTPQLMVPVQSLAVLRKASVDLPRYMALRASSDFFSTHLFALEGATREGDTFARHFVVPPDVIEDPFTGSASGGMGAYLWKYGLITEPKFVAEQGHWLKRPGKGEVEVVGSREDIHAVKVGGSAVTVLTGQLRLLRQT